jgi:protein O-GlcNAc transferase
MVLQPTPSHPSESAEEQFRRAVALCHQRQFGQAEPILRDLAAESPNPAIWNQLGLVYQHTRRFRLAVEFFHKALECDQPDPRVMSNLANMLSLLGHTTEAIESLKEAIKLAPTDPAIRSNYLMHLHYATTLDPAQLLAEHRAAAPCYPAPPARPEVKNPDPDRTLRIGYVGSDFCTHSVAWFFQAVLAGADASAETICLYGSVARPDAITELMAGQADLWRDISQMSDAQAAALIAEDNLDILIDLAGHSRGTRLGVLAHRPAPLQGTYLGYPDTTGLEAVDFRLCDAITDPPGSDAWASETLRRIEGCFVCYQPPAESCDIDLTLPCQATGQVTFGAFCNQRKINDSLLGLWATVLQAVPDSRLLLKLQGSPSDTIDAVYRDALGRLGIAPQRVEIALSSRFDQHLAMHRFVDVMLDTYPYNGTTTTCESLYHGVPVVSLTGKHHASRVGASLLSAAGLDVLATESPEQYVLLATSLARNIEARTMLRRTIRRDMVAGGLCDATRFAAALRTTLRQAWLEHLSAQPAAS